MKKNLASRLMQIILVFALVVTSIVVTPSDAKAATTDKTLAATKADLSGKKTEKYLYKKNSVPTQYVQGYNCITFDLNLTNNCVPVIYVGSKTIAQMVIEIYDENENYVTGGKFANTDKGGHIKDNYEFASFCSLEKGKYFVDIYFTTALKADLQVFELVTSVPEKCTESAPVVNGYTNWKSSNTKIATVKNGKITAKKTGSCTVTAQGQDGVTYSFPVKVVKNEYKAKAPKRKSNKLMMGCTKLAYDKSGNLKVTIAYVNGWSKKVKLAGNVSISVKNPKGKVIAKISDKNKRTIKGKKSLTVTYTVKKSKLKIKSAQDLKYSYVNIKGQYYYYR